MASQEGRNQDQTVTLDVDQRLQTQSMFESLGRLAECSALCKLIESADLAYSLRRSGLRTLFAPSNEALAGHTPEDLDAFLSAHTANGAMELSDLRRTPTVKTLAGNTLAVKATNGSFQIGNATVARADVPCTNGVIHVINSLLI